MDTTESPPLDGEVPTVQIRLAYQTGGATKALAVGGLFLPVRASEEQILHVARGEAAFIGAEPMLYVEGTAAELDRCATWCRRYGKLLQCACCGAWLPPPQGALLPVDPICVVCDTCVVMGLEGVDDSQTGAE